MIKYTYKNQKHGRLKIVENTYEPQSKVSIYIKYKNIRNVCENTNDILKELAVSYNQLQYSYGYDFNKTLLTAHGLIDIEISSINDVPNCTKRIDYNYVVNLMIILLLVTFSILFIIILYNAFLITVKERKKEYAVLNSIGGTERTSIKNSIHRNNTNRNCKHYNCRNTVYSNIE